MSNYGSPDNEMLDEQQVESDLLETEGDDPQGADQEQDESESLKSLVDNIETEAEKETRKQSRRQRAQERTNAELKALRDEVAALRGKSEGVQLSADALDELPKLEDFEDRPLSEFIAARDKALLKIAKAQAKEETQQVIRTQAANVRLNTLVEASKKTFNDWDEVMQDAEDDPVHPLQDTIDLIYESDVPGEILYHLAKNPDYHERINRLSPVRRLAELGKLEEKMSKSRVQESNRVTRAPAKLTDTPGRGANVTLDPGKAANEGYAAWKIADAARKEKQRAAQSRKR